MQCVLGRDAAIRIRRRRTVHVGRERAEALLVDELRRHCHGQVRAAVKRAVEDDDAGAAGRCAGDLDRVLDRLCARVHEQRLRRGLAGPDLVELLGDRDVGLVRPDHEALMEEPVDLLVHRPDDGCIAVAEVLAGDAARKIDVLAAVGVPDARAPGARDDEVGGRDTPRHVSLPPPAHLVRGGTFLDPHRSGVSHYRNARQKGALTYAMRSPPGSGIGSRDAAPVAPVHAVRLGALDRRDRGASRDRVGASPPVRREHAAGPAALGEAGDDRRRT